MDERSASRNQEALRQWIFMALMIALGTLANSAFSFPVGLTRCAPLQSLINVVTAVYLGPWQPGLVACVIGILRISFGTGTLFAIPGGVIGAVLAGLLYRSLGRPVWAGLGEIFGTSVLAAAASVPLAAWVLGRAETFWGFFPGFAVSSIVGGLAGILLVRSLTLAGIDTNCLKAIPQPSRKDEQQA